MLVPALCVGTDESAPKDKRTAFPRGAWERETSLPCYVNSQNPAHHVNPTRWEVPAVHEVATPYCPCPA